MRTAARLVALVIIVVGIVGFMSPDSLITLRRDYLATTVGLYVGGAVRLAMGLVLILFAPASRAPKTLRALGAVVCVQGLASALGPQFVGVDRARAVLEWEVKQGLAFLRVGAVVALAIGGFVAFATSERRSRDGATWPGKPARR
jgi:hypothetical protein